MNYSQILMNTDYLKILTGPSGSKSQIKKMEFVLDFNQFRDIIGIEIINLKFEVGERSLIQIEKNMRVEDSIRYSYDEDSDAFYMKLADGPSSDQEAVLGELIINQEGEIVEFRVKR